MTLTFAQTRSPSMNKKSLAKITELLEESLKELARLKLKDKSIRCKYAEYLVAKKLTEYKHEVEILEERGGNRSADIFLPKIGRRVEVKSSCFHDDEWADASFTDGNQIKENRFDYCVWVLFDKKIAKPKHFFVFNKDELKELKKFRKGAGRHKTNNCLLFLAPNLSEFAGYVTPFNIEKKLITHRKQFEDAWKKIV